MGATPRVSPPMAMHTPAPFRKPVLVVAVCVVAFAAACGPEPAAMGCAAEEPGYVCAVAGTGELGFNGDGKSAADTDFFLITRAERGPDGLLYFMDFNNWRIRRLDVDGVVRTIAGNGFHATAIAGMDALDSPLDNPTDFVFTDDGRLVSVSFEDPRVIAIEEGVIRVVAGTGDMGVTGNEGDGGDPLDALFMEPMGIALDHEGAIYVADAGAHRVRRIRDGVIDTVAGTGQAGLGGDEGLATAAALNHPTALAIGPDGVLYIADTFNHAVRAVDGDGIIRTVAGTGAAGLSGDDGLATEAQLNQPNGIAVDAAGALFIADRENFRIRHVAADGTIRTLAGQGEGYAGNGLPAENAVFGYLARLSFDGGSLLVADQSNSVVRRIYLE